MSIQSEITRIINYRDQSLQAVAHRGVTVPADSTIEDLPGLIGQIADYSWVEELGLSLINGTVNVTYEEA